MQIITFVIALAALVVAVLAYIRTGGIQALRNQVASVGSATDALRTRTADALDRIEGAVRGPQQPPPPADQKKRKPIPKRKTG
ncbi:MAG: hypothetical protein ACE5K9_05575 [Candidatus Methylomirabilales bacterium]